MLLNSTARPLSRTVLNVQKTQKIVPPEYLDFLPLLLEKELQQLLSRQLGINHEINIYPDFHPPFGPSYTLSLEVLKAQKQ
jgi:hypothetical protein